MDEVGEFACLLSVPPGSFSLLGNWVTRSTERRCSGCCNRRSQRLSPPPAPGLFPPPLSPSPPRPLFPNKELPFPPLSMNSPGLEATGRRQQSKQTPNFLRRRH
nr:hypothetical protein Iba_chr05cCG5010 [Ipomoea batatas]GME05834.1 hypothetical protein Iba_scaffold3462CG0070 [Ipomoea batatas]